MGETTEIRLALYNLYDDLVYSWRCGEPISIETIDKLDEILKKFAQLPP